MIGTHIGRYRIDGELGRGGMGVVYRGTQVTLERTVAIKMLPAHLADAENRERFRREALTLARLAHPNIVHIYDVEDEGGHSFIMMEHVGGGSLGDRMADDAPFSAARCVEILAPILSALHAAHLAGVVHRDIKPDNILFTESGRPKLTDFGVAHMRDAGSKTRTGVMLGTPYYMSPEQAQGRRVTAAADLYAVGVVLYEMLSGRVPFTGEDPLSVALKHLQETPRPLHELRPDLPADLCALVHRALAKDPAARFSSAAAMQDALESGTWGPGRTTLDPTSSGARAAVPATSGAFAGDTRPWGRDEDEPGTGSRPEPAATPAPVGDAAVSGAREPAAGPGGATGSTGSRELDRLAAAARSGVHGLGASGRRVATFLGRPGWRGLPVAFWAGAAALVAALGWMGAEALAGPGRDTSAERTPGAAGATPVEVTPVSNSPSPRTITPAGGGGTGTRPSTSRSTESTRRELSDEEREALQSLVRGRPDDGTATAEAAEPTDTARSSTILDRLDTGEQVETVRLDELRGTDADDEPEPDPDPDPVPTARELVRGIVERQIRAVEAGDRALFLGDFHPDVRAAAALEFDQAAAGVANIRSTISNLNIEFLESDHALVTFDVDVTFTVRADGRTERQSYGEMWDVRREGDRWWIVAWN